MEQISIGFNLDTVEDLPINRCTISTSSTGHGRYIRQTSSPSHVGIVSLRLEPFKGPHDFLLQWQVTEEQIPRDFLPAIIKGFQQAAGQDHGGHGILSQLKITITAGRCHPVDASVHGYMQATIIAIHGALTRTQLIPCV
ncbi:hypothetical protein KDA_70820 [Dictyobacter alpinus]|uniref:Translation elongation factor EFG/EF2 domain-containing protein n=1 Tax=Dictyobacter alpinus TaxID=2014873 RepID=A0A402BJR7_9CHLR|nr:hypothetical protein [Dictyobacter alpinus]GCE31598.1 hypothetical protein KDA_70820 [Dictyobacter alpinus]